MQVRSEFVLRELGSQHMVVPIGKEAQEFRGFVRLNDAGAYLWKLLEEPQTQESLASALVQRYGIDAERAEDDAKAFLEQVADFIEA